MDITRKIILSVLLIAGIPALVVWFISTSQYQQFLSFKTFIIGITALISILGIISLVHFSRSLSRMYERLNNIARGQINQKAEVPADSSISELAGSINEISLKLRKSVDDLEQRSILLERSKQEFAHAAKLQAEFMPQVIHELRAPLINIDKSANMFLEQAKDSLSGQQRDFLRIIADNAKRLLTLVGDLLNLSKMEAGKMTLNCRPFNVKQMLLEAINAVDGWRSSKGLVLNLIVDDESLEITADRLRLIQVVVNLLSNAIKFTPASGTIRVECRVLGPKQQQGQSGPWVEIVVADNGMGIASEDIPTLFEKYHASVSTNALPNTGLGLPIARQIVELHGGLIQVSSTPGIGSTFSVIIPQSAAAREQAAVSPVAASQHPPQRVLVIDDEMIVRGMLTNALRKAGYEVHAAESGLEAIRLAMEKNFDLVLTDMRMEGLNGFECIKVLKRLNPRLECIVMTGFPVEGTLAQELTQASCPCLNKPFEMSQLLQSVKNAGRAP